MSSRTPHPSSLLFRLGLGVWLIATLPGAAHSQAYTITNLGSNAWYYSEAHSINASGNVAGEFEPTNGLAPVLGFFFHDGVFSQIGHQGSYSAAYSVNTSNAVVGQVEFQTTTHAFLYANGSVVDLGSLDGVVGYSSAHAINDAGQVVAESSILGQPSTIHAATWSGSTWKDLGALGGDYSAAFGINNSGVVIGESDVVQAGVTNVHAFVYTNSMLDLGTLGGAYSSAKGINGSGVIVGEADTPTELHAFIYRDGVMRDLGTLGGSTSSASAINNAGLIVGYATDSNEVENAFLSDGTNMINLTRLIPPGSIFTNLATVDAINDAGQIAGTGYWADGSYMAYLLTPAAAPSILLSGPVWQPGGGFQLTIQSIPGQQFVLQASADLASPSNWISLWTNVLTGTQTNYTDVDATNLPARYYRAVLMP